MNVERVRSVQAESVDSLRERGNGKAADFSELMDSVLGPAKEPRTAATEAREVRSEKAPEPRETRSATTAPRKPARGEREDAETLASANADAGSDRSGETVVEAAPPATIALPQERAEAGDEADRGFEESANAAAGEVLASGTLPIWEAAATLAVPLLEGFARDGEADFELPAAEAVEVVEGVEAADDSASDRPLGTAPLQPEAELAEATNGRSVIADPKAREGFLAALEQARTAAAEVAAERRAVAVEGRSVPVEEGPSELEPEVVLERGASIDVRTLPRTDSAPRGEIEATAIRSGENAPVAPQAEADHGADEFSRGRRGDSTQPVVMPVERARSEIGPVVSAAIEGTSAGLAETTPSTPDTNAALRLDAPAPNAPARAPELPPALQTARSFPTAAPDAIAVQADWLATRGGGTARLVLNPPELGEIAIRVTVRQQAVEVVMVAQTALAHSMAEDQGERLSQAFANRDLRLEQFEVRRGDPSDSSGTGQFGSSDAGARERDRAQDEREVDRGGFGGRGLRRSGAGAAREGITPPPRVATNGRAAGVDLRI